MSILFRSEKRTITELPWGMDAWGGGHRSAAGETVNFSQTLGLDAAAAVAGLFADVVYMLPVDCYESPSKDFLTIDPPALVASPSMTVSARTWRVQALISWLFFGNTYGLVTSRTGNGYPAGVEWFDPAQVQVQEPKGILGPAVYRVNGQVVPNDEMLHIPGRFVPAGTRVGTPPLAQFKETFGLALAAQKFAARWFGDGAHPSAILASPNPVSQEQAATIKTRFVAALRGKREPAVLGAGMTYQQVQTDPKDSQMIETRQDSRLEVCRAMGLYQPEMIGLASSGSSVTYANREQRALDFLTLSADPWLVRFEDLYTANMTSPQYAKFNRAAMLRADLASRYAAHNVAIRGGWRNVNEARALEDEAPIGEEGDQYLWPPYAMFLPPPPADSSTGGQS